MEAHSAGRAAHAGPSSAQAFDALALTLDPAPPSPRPRGVLYALLVLLTGTALAIAFARVDVVAVAEGRLVPRTLLRIVQPVEAGVVQEILVDEGMQVSAGQPLLRLDARLAEADLRALVQELAVRRLQVRRIEAELAEAPLLREEGDPSAAFAQTFAQHQANRAAQADALAQARSTVERLGRELASAREIESKLQRTVPMIRSAAARFEQLRAEGFVSELAAMDRERERVEREADLAAQSHTVRAFEASLAQAQGQLQATGSSYRRALEAERFEALAQRDRLREEVDKQRVRRERVELSAPQAGIVKELAIRTVGSVVAPGAVLLTLVPAGDPVEVDVVVRNDDAGFVRAGQRAEVKVAAYPFQKYGLVPGEVLRVGPDAQEPSGNPPAAAEPPGGYRARVALATQSLAYEGTRLPLVPGMLVQAELHLGRRPLVEYLLAPVQKAWHEAGRER